MKNEDKSTVLVIEDDLPTLRQVERHLSEAGLAVVTARNGKDAIVKLYEACPDIVVSDINLPIMNGYEFCRKLRKEAGGDIPLIFISVKDDTEDKIMGFDSGGDDYVTKPFAVDELVARVKASLGRSLKSKRESSTDHLTGLLNRRAIEKWLNIEIQRSGRFRRPFSLAMLDIDHFKEINDTYGHLTGDEALRGLAGFISRRLRVIDVVGRYGGEEFMILMPETCKENAVIPLERIRSGLRGHVFAKTDSARVRLSVSIGVAEFPGDATDFEGIIAAADAALYEAKSNGRDMIRLFGG
ncbi:MAG: GGDEF domain-containing response regulator [Candidatus Nitrospinota bacterium M3_3B_026]